MRALVLALLLPVPARADDCPGRLTTVYLGASVPGGGRVGRPAWRRFVEEEVAGRLPGFTAWRADGGWTDDAGRLVRERSWVLQIVAEPDEARDGDEVDGLAAAIDEVATAYARRFRQTEVLVATASACVGHVRPAPVAVVPSRR